jgi:CRP-like cAMP-binding protein
VQDVAPTDDDLAVFARSVRALVPLSDGALGPAQRAIRVRELQRGEAWLSAGQPAHEVAVVTRGWLREFYLLADGTERTKAFVFEGEGTGSLADLMRAGGSSAFIVAEADARLSCISYALYRELCAADPEWARFHLALLERLFLRKARREFELLGLDAEGRYRALLAGRPQIEQRVAAKHLASYLGITPVHLSRLRRRRAMRAREP